MGGPIDTHDGCGIDRSSSSWGMAEWRGTFGVRPTGGVRVMAPSSAATVTATAAVAPNNDWLLAEVDAHGAADTKLAIVAAKGSNTQRLADRLGTRAASVASVQ